MTEVHPDDVCPKNWVGRTDHCWSMPNNQGEVECLFCEARRQSDAWQEFEKNHIIPSRMLAIAKGGADQTDWEVKHLAECEVCSKYFVKYQETK